MFLLLGIIGCKSKKALIPTEASISLNEEDFHRLRSEHSVPFEWFGSKANIHFETDYESLNAKLYIRMEYGKYIWMVGKKLGIEGVRVLISPEEIIALNRTNKTYFIKSFEEATSAYGIDLDFIQIQELMAGNILNEDHAKIIESKETEDLFSTTLSIGDLLIKYWQELENGILTNSKISDQRNRIILTEYSEYKQANNDQITSYIRNYNIPNTDFGNLTLELKFSNIEFDIPQNLPFEIPNHYERID